MKILLAVHHLPPHHAGGAELRAFRSAKALQARGHDVQIVCVKDAYCGTAGLQAEVSQYQGVKVHRLSFDFAFTPDPLSFEYDNPWIGDYLRRLIVAWQPDVFHLFSGYLMTGRPLLVAAEAGVPSVLTLTDYWFLCRRINKLRLDGSICPLNISAATCARGCPIELRHHRGLNRLFPCILARYGSRQKAAIRTLEKRYTFLRQAFAQTRIVISPSEFLRSALVEAGFTSAQIVQSRQGCDLREETQQQMPPQAEHKPLTLGYLGQLSFHKGVHILCEAIERLPNVPLRLRIYGDTNRFPDYVEKLRRLVRNDPRVSFEGAFHHEEFAHILREINAVVVPSIWYENSPNVILEAFASHVPVIASDLGGMAEMIQHEKSGLLFEAGNAESLARQIRRLADNPALLSSLKDGLPAVRTFSQEVDALEDIYRQITTS